MNRVGSNWLYLVVMGLTAMASAANSLEATLAKMDQAAAGFTGLTADLRKVAYHEVLKDSDTDTGRLVLKRGKAHDIRMLLDIKEPDPKTYAFEPHKVEEYLPRAQTVQEYDPGKYKSLIDQFLLLGFGSTSKEILSSYSISLGGPETIGSDKTTRLQLIPKSPEMLKYFNRVDLWISDATGLPVQQKFFAPGGDYNLATYSNMKINPNLADSDVRLNLPKGVKRERPQK